MSYLAGGMAITVRGRQVSRKEAPILVVAPHSSFLDSCIVYATKMSSVIVRKESMDNYVGSMCHFYLVTVGIWEVMVVELNNSFFEGTINFGVALIARKNNGDGFFF